MLVIFNIVGLGMIFPAALAGLAVGWLAGSEALSLVASGALAIAIDLRHRLRQRRTGPEWSIAKKADQEMWWFYHGMGGQVFLPVWMMGALFLFMGLLRLVRG
jgi:hypothetical protein